MPLADETSAVETSPTSSPTPTSFDDFFRREYRAVVGLLISVTSSRVVAEDVAQEAFAAAHLRWRCVQGYDRPDLWVRRVALNRAIGVARKRNAEQRAVERLTRFDGIRALSVEEPADEELWAAVRALPKRQTQLVALVYGDDRSIDDAAGALGLTPSTARTHLQRARATLAAALADRDLSALDGPDPTRGPR
jgi:RNA polymerase sigma-70 factor (ECF subfamily)